MIGRAGRPQYDTHGVAVVMCTQVNRQGLSSFPDPPCHPISPHFHPTPLLDDISCACPVCDVLPRAPSLTLPAPAPYPPHPSFHASRVAPMRDLPFCALTRACAYATALARFPSPRPHVPPPRTSSRSTGSFCTRPSQSRAVSTRSSTTTSTPRLSRAPSQVRTVGHPHPLPLVARRCRGMFGTNTDKRAKEREREGGGEDDKQP